jgi:glycosyltransferase involved in cell wall biosynthesis
MRIAVFHNLPSGGAKRAVLDQCRSLAARGHAVHAFVLETADEEFLPLGPHVAELSIEPASEFRRSRGIPSPLRGPVDLGRRAAWLSRTRRAQERIAERIDRGGFDVALVHPCQATQAPFVLAALRTPSIYYCQELWREAHEAPLVDPEDARRGNGSTSPAWWRRTALRPKQIYRGLRTAAEERNMRAATRVLANSRFTRESILRAFGIDAAVSYLGVDTQRFRPLGLPRERSVLSVGRISWRKGFRFLVRALGRVPAGERPRLVLIGDRRNASEEAHLAELAARSGVDIELRVRVAEEALVEAYNRALAVVFAPHLEPFGYIPIEAMACGTPAVVVAEGGPRETVVDGVTGRVVDRDEDAFARAVTELVAAPALRNAMGAAGLADVAARWSLDAAAERLLAHVGGLVPSRTT